MKNIGNKMGLFLTFPITGNIPILNDGFKAQKGK